MSWRPLRGTSHSGRFAVRASHVFHSDQNHLLWPTHHPTFHAIEKSEVPTIATRQLGDIMPINQLLLKRTQSFNACCGCPNCKGATHF